MATEQPRDPANLDGVIVKTLTTGSVNNILQEEPIEEKLVVLEVNQFVGKKVRRQVTGKITSADTSIDLERTERVDLGSNLIGAILHRYKTGAVSSEAVVLSAINPISEEIVNPIALGDIRQGAILHRYTTGQLTIVSPVLTPPNPIPEISSEITQPAVSGLITSYPVVGYKGDNVINRNVRGVILNHLLVGTHSRKSNQRVYVFFI